MILATVTGATLGQFTNVIAAGALQTASQLTTLSTSLLQIIQKRAA